VPLKLSALCPLRVNRYRLKRCPHVCFAPDFGDQSHRTEGWRSAKLRRIASLQNVLFDHLIGGHKQSLRHSESQCLSGLEIDSQVKLCGLLDREFPWLGSAQNLVHIGRGAVA
jgi:hypothetical protein